MNLNVPDNLPGTIVDLLRQEDALSRAISAEYERLIHFDIRDDQARKQGRDNISRMKEERGIVSARLSGHWRAVLTINGIKWQEENTHDG